ncbi:ATP-binding protein [candidate division NPL-UPA2 bacterium]|nr:ATP-binding protein [candidate division NPL-UPA2 bacterium]
MRIHSITVNNYRPFKVLEEVRLSQLATIVGKNDSGKSSILRAIQLFFQKRPQIDSSDVHDNAAPNENITIEIAVTSLPEKIEIEEGIETTFRDERLLDKNGHLRIRKTYPRDRLTNFEMSLITQDFQDDLFAGLANLKETELNRRCREVDIDITKAGRGITNKSKREALRAKAKEKGIETGEYELKLSPKDELWKYIESLLPDFDLFESETKTDVGEASFQSPFRPIIKTAADQPDVTDARSKFTGAIERALQGEVDKIFERLKRHTDDISALTAKPVFSWDKAVALQIDGKDHDGVDKPLEKRGSGIRRLLMVAFFEYLAEKGEEKVANFLFGIEEPENNLHPSLQRELAQSFRQLADRGYQIIITSHSPVFAGASPIEDLTLIIRKGGIARAIQHPELDINEIAEELGVEPSDQITGYKACVFVEGRDDIMFWKTVASKLKDEGYIGANFEDRGIGFVPVGGSNLKCWIDIRAMKRLNRRFAAVIDSDRKSQTDSIPQRKLNWKNQCEQDGGIFFVLRKREIENYLHRNAIERSGRTLQQYDDFTNMKKLFGENVIKVIREMTPQEILEMDKYEEDDTEHHELKEIVEVLLSLVKE